MFMHLHQCLEVHFFYQANVTSNNVDMRFLCQFVGATGLKVLLFVHYLCTCSVSSIVCKLVEKIGPLVLGSFGIMKSAGFYGHEIWWISWNLADFMVESGRFHGHDIWQISWWNPMDFMESGRFHGHEIWWISPSTPLPLNAKYPVYFCIGFHEIWWISWSTTKC